MINIFLLSSKSKKLFTHFEGMLCVSLSVIEDAGGNGQFIHSMFWLQMMFTFNSQHSSFNRSTKIYQ